MSNQVLLYFFINVLYLSSNVSGRGLFITWEGSVLNAVQREHKNTSAPCWFAPCLLRLHLHYRVKLVFYRLI